MTRCVSCRTTTSAATWVVENTDWAVDRVDTQTLTARTDRVSTRIDQAVDYISDGRGTIRVMGVEIEAMAVLVDYDFRQYSLTTIARQGSRELA